MIKQNSNEAVKNNFSIKKVFNDTFPFAIISIVLLVPLVGLKLRGWNYITRFDLLITILLSLIGFRIFISVINQLPIFKPILNKYFSQKINQPEVSKGTKKITKILLIVAVVISAIIPFVTDLYLVSILITALIYVLLSLGLNIVIGFAGLLDLGYVAFYAVGAYTVALTFKYFTLSFWFAMPLAAIVAALFGIILGFPVLRLHGDYLAIVTLGFGEIIRLVMNNWLDFTNGPNGIRLVKPYITFFGLPFTDNDNPNAFHNFFGLEYSERHKPLFIYFCLLLIVMLVVYFCIKLKEMPLGRTWEALREDEIACRSLGINHVTIKLAAFSMGAFFGGIGGSFFAAFTEFISPSSFTFIESALIVAIVVLGGLGSIPGVVIAAVVMTLLPEVLRDIAQFRILLFGIIMVVMMIWRPRGLTKVTRPRFIRKTKDN